MTKLIKKTKSDHLYCPYCGTEFIFDISKNVMKCPDENNLDCVYTFQCFDDKREADKSFINQTSIGEKYEFFHDYYKKYFVVFKYSKTETYQVRKLSDLIPASILNVLSIGLSNKLNLAVNILENNPLSPKKINEYKSDDVLNYLPSKCRINMEKDNEKCWMFRQDELNQFRKGDKLSYNIISQCPHKGLHWRFPIVIEGEVIALILAGGFQIVESTSFNNIIEVAEEILKLDDRKFELRKNKFVNFKVYLSDDQEDNAQTFRNKYYQFKSIAENMSSMFARHFTAGRSESEDNFLHELQCMFDRKYEIVVDVQWYWKRLNNVLSRLNEYLNFNGVILLSNHQFENILNYRCGSPETIINLISAKTIKITKDFELFIESKQDLFFHKSLRQNRLYKFDTKNIYNMFESFIDDSANHIPIAISPINISVREENKIACIVYFGAKNKKNIHTNKLFYRRIASTISLMLKHIYAEDERMDYLKRMDHELMKPVSGIKNIAYLIQGKFPFKKIEKIIPNDCNNLKNNIQSIIDFAEAFSIVSKNLLISKGTWSADIKKTEILFYDRIAWTVFRLHRREIKYKKITLDFTELKHMPIVFNDQAILFQVYYNVINNAVKYSFEESVIIVDFRITQRLLEISVTNTGIEIIKGEEHAIFQRGVRGSNASSIDARGTGEGLSACKVLLNKINGQIEFTRGNISNINIFNIRFPFSNED